MSCSIARSMAVAGEPWSPLVIRDVYIGINRFDDLQRDLGISRKVLSERLGRLVNAGLLERRRYSERPPRHDLRPHPDGVGVHGRADGDGRLGRPLDRRRRRAAGPLPTSRVRPNNARRAALRGLRRDPALGRRQRRGRDRGWRPRALCPAAAVPEPSAAASASATRHPDVGRGGAPGSAGPARRVRMGAVIERRQPWTSTWRATSSGRTTAACSRPATRRRHPAVADRRGAGRRRPHRRQLARDGLQGALPARRSVGPGLHRHGPLLRAVGLGGGDGRDRLAPEAMEPLVNYRRRFADAGGIDWDDYRARMERERRVLIRIHPSGPDRTGRAEAAQTKRFTKARAVSATSRQPPSIVSEWPRPGDLNVLGDARVVLVLLVAGGCGRIVGPATPPSRGGGSL